MAYALSKPVVGVPTLDALAYGVHSDNSLICPIMNARNNQVYSALFKWEKQKLIKLTEYLWVNINDFTQQLKEKNAKVIFNGDAANLHKELLESELGDLCEFALPNQMLQRASSVANLALLKAKEGISENCYDLVPFYLRKSQPERLEE